MKVRKYLRGVLLGAGALAFTGARFAGAYDGSREAAAPLVSFTNRDTAAPDSAKSKTVITAIEAATHRALDAIAGAVQPLSSSSALEDAFRSYFAFKTAHPDQVRNPYLYFVDYGLPSTAPRGYVFDMSTLKILDGPFTVAHGRGSSSAKYGVPTRFSNDEGSAATSLGLYLTEGTYPFVGETAGHAYRSLGLRLVGVSGDFNDNAFSRRVVAHGAPYVTPTKAGRSEGCPAMEQSRARRLLPKLADGGMVFLFAPDSDWLAGDPWLNTAAAE